MKRMRASMLKKIIKEEISATLREGDWYSDEYETMADRKYADNPAQEMKDRIAAHQGVEPARARSGQEVADELESGPSGGLREPWDGIEENAHMIGDNAIKIEYLARAMGVEIPIDLSSPRGPKGW